MLDRYIFDLDNTLIYTNMLNNDSYNYALCQKGLSAINDCARITRDVVYANYPHLNDDQKREIIMLKQEYFISNMHITKPNISMLEVLQTKNAEYCFLWTSAEEIRVQALLEYYRIKDSFKKVLYSNKINVLNEIQMLCEVCECKLEQLIIYEDNHILIEKLQQLNLNIVSV